MPRYLRQIGSGHLYGWTETLAKRKDMVEEDLETVQRRIEAIKERKRLRQTSLAGELIAQGQELSALTAASLELSTLESEEIEIMSNQRKKEEYVSAIDPRLLKPDDLVKREREMSAEEIEEDHKSRILAGDKEYQSVLAMRSKDAITLYLQENFGVLPDDKMKLEQLRVLALTKRAERIFEVK
jgi:hypothetical protein